MPQTGAGTRGAAARPPRRSGQLRPKLDGLDLVVQLWRAKWLMLLIFAPLAAVAVAGALSLPETYTAQSRLLVAADEGAGGEALEMRARSEAALLRSPVVAQAALKQVTLARAYPGIAMRCKPEACAQLGAEAAGLALAAESAVGSPVITARFAHADPEISADMLNALVAAYLAYRKEVFTDTRLESLREQREAYEAELAGLDAAIRDYLFTNNLTDLSAERDTLRQLYQSASADLLAAQSRLRQAEAQLENYRRQLRSVPSEIDGAAAVEPAEVGEAESVLRRVPNPLYQQIEAAIATLQSEVQAARGREAELKSQIAAFETRQRRLVELAPDLQDLERRRGVAERSIRTLSEQEADVRTRNALTLSGADAVRVLEAAAPPVSGASLREPAMLLGLLLAGIAAFAAGLVRAVTRRGFATPGALERTLNLPVLAVVPKY